VSDRGPDGSTPRFVVLWGPVLVMMAGIFVASSIPNLGPLPGQLSDKTAHFMAYAALGLLSIRATAQARWSGVTGPALATAWLVCAVYAASDELHQLMIPGRTAAFDDWVADALGSASALLVVAGWARLGRTSDRTL
jgi:VanZ family protein